MGGWKRTAISKNSCKIKYQYLVPHELDNLEKGKGQRSSSNMRKVKKHARSIEMPKRNQVG